MNKNEPVVVSPKHRRAAGVGPYIFSLLIIIIPAMAAYYFHLQSQTGYHQKREFRTLDEAGRLLDRNISAFDQLHQKIKIKTSHGKTLKDQMDSYAASIQHNSIFTDISFGFVDKRDKTICPSVDSGTFAFIQDQGHIKLVQKRCVEVADSTEYGRIKSTVSYSYIKSTVSLDLLLADLQRRREFDVIALARPDGDVLYSTETARSDFLSDKPGEQLASRTKHYSNIENLLKLASCKLQQNGFKAIEDRPCDSVAKLGQAALVEVVVGDTTKLVFIQPYMPKKEKIFCDFTQNNCDANKGSGYLVGVIDASRFSGRVQRIPPNIVAAIALFVLIALLLAPYLRIALGGPLASVSRLFTGYLLSAGVLSAGITVIFLLWATMGRSILETSDYVAEEVAANIEADVRHEIIEMLGVYKYLRDKVNHPSTKPEDSASICVSDIQGNKSQGLSADSPSSDDICSGYHRPPYRVMFFADENGDSIDKDKYIFDYRDNPLKKVNISRRNYFQQANVNGLALNKFQGESESIKALPAFAIERIVSYSTGSLSMAIAIPEQGLNATDLDKAKVGVISGPLQSLSAPVLPTGFHFAIIEDASGLVVAHDNTGRVLVEDFFREADDNPELRAAVQLRQNRLFHGKYHGRESLFFTRSIQGIPWSVIVIQDKTLVQMARFEIAAIALGELLVFFMVIGVCIFGTVIFWHREPWAWLWPMRRNIFDNHSSIFWVAIIVLLVVLAVGVTVILNFSGFWLFFWTVITILAGAHLMYLVSVQPFDVKLLWVRRWRTPAMLALASLLLIGLLISLYGVFTSEGRSLNNELPFYLIGAVLIIALTYGVPKWLQVLWEKPRKGESNVQDGTLENRQNTTRLIVSEPLRRFRHITAGVLCLLMFGGLPAGAAFKDAYVTYMDLLFRYSAIDTAAALDRRVAELRNYIASLGQVESERDGLAWTKAYRFSLNDKDRGIFLGEDLLPGLSNGISSFQISESVGNTSLECNRESKNFSMPGLASFIVDKVFPVDEQMARLHLAHKQCSDDGQWYWRDKLDSTGVELVYLTENGLAGSGVDSNDWMILRFNSKNFYQFSPFYSVSFVLLMLLYIGVLYFQVSITGARLGGTKIPFILHRSGKRRPNKGKVDFESLFFNHRMVLRELDKNIYVKTSQNPAAKCEILKLDTANKLEFSKLQQLLDADKNIEVKILHLVILVDDLDQRRKILPLLECLVKENSDTKITLYADINPLYRLTRPDAYRDNTSGYTGFVRDSESLRWSNLLSKFAKEYAWAPRDNLGWLDWKDMAREGDLTIAREMRIFNPDSKIEALLKQKLLHSRKDGLYAYNDDIPPEDVVALTSELAGAYYRKLWEECTHNERVLLHTLAAGRCVNTLNIEIISHLMRRGLVVMEPSLRLVNESFAGFIRDAETPETFQQWKNDEEEKGAWQALRIPFMFLLFVPIAILLVVATEELNGGIALMAPILTIIPLLMKGLGLRAQGSA